MTPVLLIHIVVGCILAAFLLFLLGTLLWCIAFKWKRGQSWFELHDKIRREQDKNSPASGR